MNSGITPTVELATTNGTYPYPVYPMMSGFGGNSGFGGFGDGWFVLILLALLFGNGWGGTMVASLEAEDLTTNMLGYQTGKKK